MPLARLVGRVPIGLGTDWTASNNSMDMLIEARLAALVGKMRADDPQALPVGQMVRMLTIDGARVLGLDGLIGSIEAGKRADLVVFDANKLETTPARDVLVDGAILVRDGKLTRDDEAALARRHRTHGRPPS